MSIKFTDKQQHALASGRWRHQLIPPTHLHSVRAQHTRLTHCAFPFMDIRPSHNCFDVKYWLTLTWSFDYLQTYDLLHRITFHTSLRCHWQTRATQSKMTQWSLRPQMSTVSVINWWPRLSPVYHTDRPTKDPSTPATASKQQDICIFNLVYSVSS